MSTQFNFTYAPGVSVEEIMGFEAAGQFWSQYLADDVGINIYVEMTDSLAENVLGGALPGMVDDVRYQDFRTKLAQDIDTTYSDISGVDDNGNPALYSVDSLINRHQQQSPEKYTAYFTSEYDSNGYFKVDNNQYIDMTRANAKALGIINGHDTELDGYIMMRDLDGVGDGVLNSYRWSYDYQNYYDSDSLLPNDKIDFLSVAIHEIGHILGFTSGLDQAPWIDSQRTVTAQNESDYYANMTGQIKNVSPLDMLRFSAGSTFHSGLGDNWVDLSLGGNPYLSFDGGQTAVAYFSTGTDTTLGGDGNQASHWKKHEDALGNPLGIMDPTLGGGQRRKITKLDADLFDAIGWDLKMNSNNIESTNLDLSSILTASQQKIVDKITSSASQLGVSIDLTQLNQWSSQSYSGSSSISNYVRNKTSETLTRDFIDIDNNGNGDGKDDRTETLIDMIANSGTIYDWGWSAYTWPYASYSQIWDSMNMTDTSQDGFWQNLSWQKFN